MTPIGSTSACAKCRNAPMTPSSIVASPRKSAGGWVDSFFRWYCAMLCDARSVHAGNQGEDVGMCPPVDPEAFREFDREGHNRLAESYAVVFTPITGLAVGQLLEAAGVGK